LDVATYKQIQDRVKAEHGFVPKTCWIVDVKSSYGLTMRQAPNRFSENSREYPCPPQKRPAIEAAMKFYGMIA
jgi:hypothetical protein